MFLKCGKQVLMKFIMLIMKVIHIIVDYVSLLPKELKLCYIVLIMNTKIKINVYQVTPYEL